MGSLSIDSIITLDTRIQLVSAVEELGINTEDLQELRGRGTQ
jgi:hypothetical protein